MALLAVLTSKDQIPEGMESHYVEREGKFFLDLDNESIKLHPSTHALKRAYDATSTELEQTKGTLKTLKEQFEGIDPEKAKNLMESEERTRIQKLGKDGQFETIVADAKARAAKEYELQIEKLKQEKADAIASRNDSIIENQLHLECVKAGLPDIAPLLLPGAKETFAVEKDDQLVALDSQGRKMVVNGETPLTLGAWIETQIEKFKLRPPSTGGDGRPPAPKASRIVNPWMKETFNLTKQMEITQSNPELANRFKQEAGAA